MDEQMAMLVKAAYNAVVKDLQEVGIMCTESGCDFSTQTFIMQFDAIIQYSLLQYALLDNKLSEDEIKIIVNVTDYGDFVEFVKTQGYDVEWEDIYNTSSESLKKWLAKLEDAVDELGCDFGKCLAILDSVTSKDYLEAITTAIITLFTAFGHADGEYNKEEETAKIQDLYIFQLLCAVIDLKAELLKDDEEK